jgi:hypothetical protein
MLVDVETELYEKLTSIVKEKPIDFVSKKQFVNLAVKEKIEKICEKSC